MLRSVPTGKNTKSHQQGMVLVVALVMVLLMSITAVSAIRGSNMQELMAGNMKERNQAFQAAEAALRMAEVQVQTNGTSLVFGNANGLFSNQNKHNSTLGSVSHWTSATWDSNAIKLATSRLDLKLAREPDYVIEQLEITASGAAATGNSIEYGSAVDEAGPITLYRLTSRGFGGSESTVVILQSTYRAQH